MFAFLRHKKKSAHRNDWYLLVRDCTGGGCVGDLGQMNRMRAKSVISIPTTVWRNDRTRASVSQVSILRAMFLWCLESISSSA